MIGERQQLCKVCGRKFIPNKYHPYQRVCLKSDCQIQRQKENIKRWRERNPNYSKVYLALMSPAERQYWEKRRCRKKNLEYARDYRNKNPDKYRKYMRTYMREARILVRRKELAFKPAL